MPLAILLRLGLFALALATLPAQSFVNWESPHGHPIDLTPDGQRLLAVNTADARLEVYQLTALGPVFERSIPVGLDPVSVRARTGAEAWVVNHISDSVSVVDLQRGLVVRTIRTGDEPMDVVFAGTPQRAFVSCSQTNTVQVYELDGREPLHEIAIAGEDPRALAVSPDGNTVYVAIFESGNGTTVLGGGAMTMARTPGTVVSDPLGPYGGQNPPPNRGTSFDPPLAPGLPAPPRVSHIVRKDANGRWMDDNNADWSLLVSGAEAQRSGRIVGWDLPDRDIAAIDANNPMAPLRYANRLLTMVMNVATDPISGRIVAIGTEARNEVRFEPNLTSRFSEVRAAVVDPATLQVLANRHLNAHLDQTTAIQIPQAERRRSLGDPRGLAISGDGMRAYVVGMGSNNLVAFNLLTGARIAPALALGEGPTGIILDEPRRRAYVLERFAARIAVIDLAPLQVLTHLPFHDATPEVIRRGRKHLYDTHLSSGLGQVSCATCHVDSRFDRLAWDLGNPAGAMKSPNDQNLKNGAATFRDWHPMKGPMTTQTLQDIIEKEPLHWRGDKRSLQEFAGAFTGLLGDDAEPDAAALQEFEDYLATITFPPNPFRTLQNGLPSALDLNHIPASGRFAPGGGLPPGAPLGIGDATRGLDAYVNAPLMAGGGTCVECHTLPLGMGTDFLRLGQQFSPFPLGPGGERHIQLVASDGFTNASIKTPQLRNMYDKVGFEVTSANSNAGFGYVHDGTVDTLARFLSGNAFAIQDDQQMADVVAFMMAFSGSDLPLADGTDPNMPPGELSKDTHAAVGQQVTFDPLVPPSPTEVQVAIELLLEAEVGRIGLIAHGQIAGQLRGFVYAGLDLWVADRAGEIYDSATLVAQTLAAPLTLTATTVDQRIRLALDRDGDGAFDQTERDLGTDPSDPTQGTPVLPPPLGAQNLRVEVRGPNAVVLRWTDQDIIESGFRIERREASGAFTLIATTPSSTTAWTDYGLTEDTTYEWRVTATAPSGDGAPALASATTGPDLNLPRMGIANVFAQPVCNNNQTRVRVVVVVRDAFGNPVEDAVVRISLSGATDEPALMSPSSPTGLSVFQSQPVPGASGTWTLTLETPRAPDRFRYDPSLNLVPSTITRTINCP